MSCHLKACVARTTTTARALRRETSTAQLPRTSADVVRAHSSSSSSSSSKGVRPSVRLSARLLDVRAFLSLSFYSDVHGEYLSGDTLALTPIKVSPNNRRKSSSFRRQFQ